LAFGSDSFHPLSSSFETVLTHLLRVWLVTLRPHPEEVAQRPSRRRFQSALETPPSFETPPPAALRMRAMGQKPFMSRTLRMRAWGVLDTILK